MMQAPTLTTCPPQDLRVRQEGRSLIPQGGASEAEGSRQAGDGQTLDGQHWNAGVARPAHRGFLKEAAGDGMGAGGRG